MSSAVSAYFPEGVRNIREAVRNAEASRIVCGRRRSLEDRQDVLTMSARQCGQSAEGVTKFISASKFCSGPKSRRGKSALSRRRRNAEVFRGDKDSERNLSGICGQVAESCGLINAAFRVLSASCPGPSGRLALYVNLPCWHCEDRNITKDIHVSGLGCVPRQLCIELCLSGSWAVVLDH